MIEKTCRIGDRVIIHDPTNSEMFKNYNGKPGTLISRYGRHYVNGNGMLFWGYYVKTDSGHLLGVSRHMLAMAERSGPRRGDLDKVVKWSDCAWQPKAA